MNCLLLYLCLLCFNIYHICSYETLTLPYFDLDKGRKTILYFGEHTRGVHGILSLTSQYTILTNKTYKREQSSSSKLNFVNKTIANIYDVFQTNKYNFKSFKLKKAKLPGNSPKTANYKKLHSNTEESYETEIHPFNC